jgi:hypothetical protein
MAFADVRPARETREIAENRRQREGVEAGLTAQGLTPLGGGRFAAKNAEGPAGGDDNFYEDPTVGALVKLPSLKEAQEYTGKTPSFYGVQRPGDWQRKVQKDMAADALGSREALAAAIDARVQLARRGGGPFQV